jgi:hypothetical protein
LKDWIASAWTRKESKRDSCQVCRVMDQMDMHLTSIKEHEGQPQIHNNPFRKANFRWGNTLHLKSSADNLTTIWLIFTQ